MVVGVLIKQKRGTNKSYASFVVQKLFRDCFLYTLTLMHNCVVLYMILYNHYLPCAKEKGDKQKWCKLCPTTMSRRQGHNDENKVNAIS